MSKNRDLDRGDVLPASWTDSIQEFISTLTSNLVVEMASATSIEIPASSGSGQVAIGIGGLWRYRDTTASASLPSSSPATYAIWVSATDNSFSNSPTPDTDNTDYDFGLHVTTGAAPSGGGIVQTREIGEVDFDGATITEIRLLPGVGTGAGSHAIAHNPGGSDELDWDAIASTIHLTGTAGARPAAAVGNAGYVYFASDTGAISRSTGSTWTTFTDSTKANIASPTFTGTPAAPTAAVDTNTTQVATTAYVIGQGYLKSATAATTYAPLASPALTGTPTAPTQSPGNNTTRIATTAFVADAIATGGGAYQAYSADLDAIVALSQTAYGIGILEVANAAAARTYISAAAATHTHTQADVTNLTSDLAAKAPLASPTFTGTPAGPTAAADTNTTQLATTAYVVGQGYLKSATAASTYAPLADPTFTGTPDAPTAAVDTNTTQLATTAFVLAQAASANPVMNGTVAVGTSTRYARADHVHATDTSRAPLASPTFTGTPAAPTAAVDTNTTQLATTAYVVGQGYLKSATASTTYAPLASPTFTGVVTVPVGAVGTPPITFSGDTNTGIYQGASAADTVSVAVGGNNAATFGSGGSLKVAGTFAVNGATPAARPDYTVTNGATDRTFNANALSIDELADVVSTLVADLTAIGLLQ
jgi:hypothetical protein